MAQAEHALLSASAPKHAPKQGFTCPRLRHEAAPAPGRAHTRCAQDNRRAPTCASPCMETGERAQWGDTMRLTLEKAHSTTTRQADTMTRRWKYGELYAL